MGAGVLLVVVCAVAAEPRELGRPIHEVHRDLRQLLQRESQAAAAQERAEVVRQMCALHDAIVRDPRFAKSDVLKQYRGQLWSRLTKVKATLQRQFPAELTGAGKQRRTVDWEAADPLAIAASQSLTDSLAILEQSQTGLGSWAALGGGPVAADWGPELVELIERTIHPAFWNVAGGPGTIVYYRPLQCLVVRATSEVHGQVGRLVDDVRGADR